MEKSVELLQTQLDATFWEGNYCKQRAIVLQIQAERIEESIKKKTKDDKIVGEKDDC